MKSYGPGDMQAPTHRHANYDCEAEAKRISEIDNAIERRQALERVPYAFRSHVDGMVGMLFRSRVRGN